MENIVESLRDKEKVITKIKRTIEKRILLQNNKDNSWWNISGYLESLGNFNVITHKEEEMLRDRYFERSVSIKEKWYIRK